MKVVRIRGTPEHFVEYCFVCGSNQAMTYQLVFLFSDFRRWNGSSELSELFATMREASYEIQGLVGGYGVYPSYQDSIRVNVGACQEHSAHIQIMTLGL